MRLHCSEPQPTPNATTATNSYSQSAVTNGRIQQAHIVMFANRNLARTTFLKATPSSVVLRANTIFAQNALSGSENQTLSQKDRSAAKATTQ